MKCCRFQERQRSGVIDFDSPVDGLITHWDFPFTSLLAMLADERDLPAPSPAAMLRCVLLACFIEVLSAGTGRRRWLFDSGFHR